MRETIVLVYALGAKARRVDVPYERLPVIIGTANARTNGWEGLDGPNSRWVYIRGMKR